MKTEHLFIPSHSDGLKLYTTIMIPDKTIRGIVQFVHGMVEHQIYYYDLMKFLTKVGYVTVIHDLRGHGKSVWSEADLGYFYEEKAEFVVEDVIQITRMMKERYPKVPVYLFGHSMGSLIARKYLKKYDKEVEKVILSGSPSKNSMVPSFHNLCMLMKKIYGERYRSKFLNNIALTNKAPDKWLSINPSYLKEYQKDKYCSYIFTINGFLNLTQLMIDVYSNKDWNLNHSTLPILFLVGSDDPIVKGKKEFFKSVEFLKTIGYSNVTYKVYYGCKHVVFKDKPNEVFAEILSFLEN